MADSTPVIIGVGQFSHKGDPLVSPSPTKMLKIAAERAAADAGLPEAALRELDALGVVAFAMDAREDSGGAPIPSNPPLSLSRKLGASPRWSVYGHVGGNGPQQLINTLAERISRGETRLGLAAGCEFMGALARRARAGRGFEDWDEQQDDPPPERLGEAKNGTTPYETRHGLRLPIVTYPLFENALRARDGRSIEDHQRRLGELFASFTKVAAANPYAWFPTERSAEELVTVTERNRMVGFPYTKYLNAVMEVDQSAAVLIASVDAARELGVPEDRFVYLHGCAEASDLWYPLERQNYHSNPAMRLTGRKALEMAGLTLDQIDLFDLYSCFPVAVEIGAEELGLALDDPRGLTVTGGLPYAGGPGNDYVMHSIATMTERLRERPGSFGLVTGNGYYLTKQTTGVYSTKRPDKPFEREEPTVLQREIDALPHPEIVEHPQGPARIETYTVVHGREGYQFAVVVGRDAQDRRFIAHTPDEAEFLRAFEAQEQVGRPGVVGPHPDGQRNLFRLN